ncbi:irregular chiasm C-roughest protein [Trichonephila clavipes]|nr:irregular chiasm C-roughest protein [Trichonephila clavipes]
MRLTISVKLASGRDESRRPRSTIAPSASDRPPQYFAIEPADRTAIVGKPAVLPCRVLNKIGTLQWTRDGFGLGSDRELRGFPRYTMVGSDDEGDFSLQISSVTLDDDAMFQCQVVAADGVAGIRSRNAAFTVYEGLLAPTHSQVIKAAKPISLDQSRFKLISGPRRRRSISPLSTGGSKFITRKSG